MTTSLDTNILVALWNTDDVQNDRAEAALDGAFFNGRIVICGPVFSELLACPGRTQQFIDDFLQNTDISVEWEIDESVWRAAGEAFRSYSEKRRRQKTGMPRRILADFIIGAHADENGYSLLTFDAGIYRSAFPELKIIES